MRRGDGNGQVTLVAMPPSAEVFIARDDGVLWLVSPPGAGGPERVNEEIVERAVAQHGFERIDQDFDGWAELDAERQRRAGEEMPEVQVDLEHFDAEDVEGLLGALESRPRPGPGSARAPRGASLADITGRPAR